MAVKPLKINYMTTERVFDQAAGLGVQVQQLKFWERILKPECFAKVQAEAQARNRRLSPKATGYDVWRGTDIDNFVHNAFRK